MATVEWNFHSSHRFYPMKGIHTKSERILMDWYNKSDLTKRERIFNVLMKF